MKLIDLDTPAKLQAHLILSLLLKVSMLLGAILCFIWGHFMLGVFSLIITLISSIPLLMSNHYRITIPPEFECLGVVFIFATLYLGNIFDFYSRYWWWDAFLHTSSGFILGILGFLLVFVLNGKKEINLDFKPHFTALFAFLFAVTLGTIWEIFEFAMDFLFAMDMQGSSLIDTMSDLIVDTGGSLFISVLGYIFLRNSNDSSFLENWLSKFIEKNPKLFKAK